MLIFILKVLVLIIISNLL